MDPVLTHNDLIEALLSNPEGAALVGGAATALKRSESSTAAIMIAQFSKQYTDSNTPPPDIQREKVKGTWSYWSTIPRTSEILPFDKMVKAMDEVFGKKRHSE